MQTGDIGLQSNLTDILYIPKLDEQGRSDFVIYHLH